MPHPLHNKTIFITGGTGFIGSRLVELLVLDCGARVRLLVRNFARSVRIARLGGLDFIPGSLEDEAAIVQGCQNADVVMHCAIGQGGTDEEAARVTVQGTQHVIDAAIAAKVPRVVHVSSLAVYGEMPDGPLDETHPYAPSEWSYCQSKREAERLMLAAHQQQGLAASVIQPTFVYGPWGKYFTMAPLENLRNGAIATINGDRTHCNPVYVDDVVQMILLAATRDQAVGETFLASGPEAVSWHDFLHHYEQMLGVSDRLISVDPVKLRHVLRYRQPPTGTLSWAFHVMRDRDDVRAKLWNFKPVGWPLRVVKAVLPGAAWRAISRPITGEPLPTELPIAWPALTDEPMNNRKAVVKIDKARRLLGYEPAYDLQRGMAMTEKWAKWAGLA